MPARAAAPLMPESRRNALSAPPPASGLTEREKVPMEPLVMGELGMEARGKQPSLPRGDDRVACFREHLDPRTDASDDRSADEHRVERIGPEYGDLEVRFEAIDLTAEGVALDGHVHERGERVRMAGHVLRHEDRPRARAPHRHPRGGAIAQLLDDPVLLRELSDRRALAARDDERVDLVKLLRAAHVDRFHTEPIERGEVLRKVALETQDTGARD